MVGDIPVTTDGQELCLLVRLVSTSRKLVLFAPRPWYRWCCWRITNRLPSDMPCYHDRARCHRFFYLYFVWWAHNPQFHRIETWLSCTPRLKKLFLAFDFIWNSRATCPMTYFWYQTQYLFPLPRILFALCFKHRMIACPLETSHDTSLLCSRYFLKFRFESYSRHLPRCIDQIVNLVEVSSPGMPTPCPSYVRWSPRRKEDDFIMMTWSRGMKASTYWIDLFEKSNQHREDPLKFRN